MRSGQFDGASASVKGEEVELDDIQEVGCERWCSGSCELEEHFHDYGKTVSNTIRDNKAALKKRGKVARKKHKVRSGNWKKR